MGRGLVVSVPFRGFYLLNEHPWIFKVQSLRVSVPFRGFYLLNQNACNERSRRKKQFPSPSGVSIFSIKEGTYMIIASTVFPSPSGVSIFSIVNGEASDALWNSWFPSPSGVSIFSILKKENKQWINTVSVPFRGFYLLNIEPLRIREKGWFSFPSPSGVSIFSIILFDSEGKVKKVSVPFRGFYLLNLDKAFKRGFCWFPSPSGVSIFSMNICTLLW